MRIEVVTDDRLGSQAAARVAATLRAAVAERGRASVAFSGGSTARTLLSALAEAEVPWSSVEVLQVDERVAPHGHRDRNLTTLQQRLLDHIPLPEGHLHAMPVEEAGLDIAATRYADLLHDIAGRPPRLDLVHLGLGSDGHTASLVPGSPLLDGCPDPVAVTPPYHGRRRMTLTLPTLSGARQVLWLVSGQGKAPVVRRLVDGDDSIPAGRVDAAGALLLVDPQAAADLPAQTRSEDP